MSYEFLIVGLGSSAGGLKALTTFFSNVDPEVPVAYVIVQHASREYTSQIPSLFSRVTQLPVDNIYQGMPVEPSRIYVCPASTNVSLSNGVFLLKTRSEQEVINRTINHFFSSLAKEARESAVGIIMSGTGSDGTEGFEMIAKYHGTTIVQEPSTAEFDSMPLYSIRFDHPDFILAPEDMPGKVYELWRKKTGSKVNNQN